MFNPMYSDRGMAWGFSNPFGLGPTLAGKAGRGRGTILIPCNTQYMHLKQYLKQHLKQYFLKVFLGVHCVLQGAVSQNVSKFKQWQLAPN